MNKISYLSILLSLLLSGCQSVLPARYGFMSLSEITKHGYARNKNDIRALEGKVIKIWGYLDVHNIALKAGTIKNQPFFWGELLVNGNAYFDLKPYASPNSVSSIRIHIEKDLNKYKKIFEKLSDAKEKAIMVYVTGKLHAFEAPMNFNASVGVMLNVSSPKDIIFENQLGNL